MSGHDPDTLDFYQREAAHYVGVRPEEESEELIDFLSLLQPGARILELGCGSGIDAQAMIARGFDVMPTDGVPAMAAQAEGRLGIPVRVMRFEELGAVDAFDAIVACASLLHVPRAGLPDSLSRIWRGLKPGGWHLATFKTGGDEGVDEFGRYYNYPDQALAETLYRGAGPWQSLTFEESMGQGYFSKPARWLKVIAQKA